MNLLPIEIGKKCVEKYFPNCLAAVLAGSAVRGRINEQSDLDIVIIDESAHQAYKTIYSTDVWPVEAFVFNTKQIHGFFLENYNKAMPTLHRILSDGVIIHDKGIGKSLCKEAKVLLNKGPQPWSLDEMNKARFDITDYLKDLIGSESTSENLYVMNRLVELIPYFILRVNDHWIGDGKWMLRELRDFDPKFCAGWLTALEAFYKQNEKREVIEMIDIGLSPYGGRLYEGFTQVSTLNF
jgi:predicted nucleotidyltransferase